MPKLPVNRLMRRPIMLLVSGVLLLAASAATLPAAADANSSQIAIIQDNSDLYNAPAALAQFRELGARAVRIIVPWSQIAPDSSSPVQPNFDATDPSAYPADNWAPYDNIVRTALTDGITVDFTITGGAPRWAERGNPPENDPFFAWQPNVGDYEQFVQAVGERYSGQFTPSGEAAPLPAVHFWAIFNEPNFGEDLGPQAIKGSSVSVAPMMYRNLVNAGWKGLQATGHGHDTILIGELAARGNNDGPPHRGAPQGLPGDYGQTKPLEFIRSLYCVDRNFHELRGSFAKARGCPTSAAASRSFRRQNPGLFNASGVSDHPYPLYQSPVTDGLNDPDFATLPDLGNLAHTLDRVNSVYGSHTHFAIYNTEYGYITRPPKAPPYVTQSTAAWYINWAEYLSYKNPRVRSYMQYLLTDPPPTSGAYAGFASGLETYKGQPKATFYAYRMPVYMPRTAFSRNRSEEIWGAVRPAPFALLDGYGGQLASIQLKSGAGAYRTLKTFLVTRSGGYFDLHMRFPSSGTVRIAWTYPAADPFLASPNVAGQTIYSRTFSIKVH